MSFMTPCLSSACRITVNSATENSACGKHNARIDPVFVQDRRPITEDNSIGAALVTRRIRSGSLAETTEMIGS
jgi:hypothetical protein